MWVDVQKGCGMGLGGHAYLRVPSFVHPLSGRQLRRFAPPLPSRGTHEVCETVLDGFHAFLRTQYAMRQAEGAARGVTSLH